MPAAFKPVQSAAVPLPALPASSPRLPREVSVPLHEHSRAQCKDESFLFCFVLFHSFQIQILEPPSSPAPPACVSSGSSPSAGQPRHAAVSTGHPCGAFLCFVVFLCCCAGEAATGGLYYRSAVRPRTSPRTNEVNIYTPAALTFLYHWRHDPKLTTLPTLEATTLTHLTPHQHPKERSFLPWLRSSLWKVDKEVDKTRNL